MLDRLLDDVASGLEPTHVDQAIDKLLVGFPHAGTCEPFLEDGVEVGKSRTKPHVPEENGCPPVDIPGRKSRSRYHLITSRGG